MLQNYYIRRMDVLNRGFGGYKTSWIVDYMLDSMFDVLAPRMVVLFVGVKDTVVMDAAAGSYTSPDEFSAQVHAIKTKAADNGVRYFVVITPPPVCETCRAIDRPNGPWDRYNNHTELYVAKLATLVNETRSAWTPGRMQAVLVDIFHEWQAEADWNSKYLLQDNLHLSPEGHKQLFQAITAAVEQGMPNAARQALPIHWPSMDVIDHQNPEVALLPVKRSCGADAAGMPLELHSGSELEHSGVVSPVVQPVPVSSAEAVRWSAWVRALLLCAMVLLCAPA